MSKLPCRTSWTVSDAAASSRSGRPRRVPEPWTGRSGPWLATILVSHHQPREHLIEAKRTIRVPHDDYDGYVEAHVRRLEALRRAGIVERINADNWIIPEDFEQRAADYDAKRRRTLSVRVLSAFDLEAQITSDGATWLDRQLVSRDSVQRLRVASART